MGFAFSFGLSWIAIVIALPHVKHSCLSRRIILIRSAIKSDVQNDAAAQRLPLLQFYDSGNIISEVWFNDAGFNLSLAKFKAFIRRFTSDTISSSCDHTLVNIYSDAMLTNVLSKKESSHQVLKVYRLACKSCQRFEPTFASAVQKYGTQVTFLQANVDHIPDHMNIIRSQYFGSGSESVAACQICYGNGKVTCTNCLGKGFAMNGSIAVICGSCGGKNQCDEMLVVESVSIVQCDYF